jgi:hypothetical protein
VKNIGKPCAGELHARFDEGGQAKHSTAGLVRHRQAKAAVTDRPSLPDEEPVLYSTLPYPATCDLRPRRLCLAWAFVEAAHFAVRYDAQIKRWYQKKAAKTLPVVAIKAVAHKLARACYHILKTGEAFDVTRAFS